VTHKYFSQRAGTNPNPNGLPLRDICELFEKVFDQLRGDGFFDEALGSYCVDAGAIPGKIGDIDLEILLAVRKKDLWPIADQHCLYSEDDLFDLIEFLYQHVSKPIDGTMHSFANCGMHWEVFSQEEGKKVFKDRINMLLQHYENHFELSEKGQVLKKAEAGFEPIFNADVPSTDSNVVGRINSAIIRFRRHGSNMDDRRQAVRDLVDVLEYLRPQVKEFFTSKDEGDLFNIANNFGIRHLNEKQKTSYDENIWLSWMFYFYLSTIHVLLRKIGHQRGMAT
jgi:hypothetical protein